MNTLRVSVIIPNYCHARYLDERIQSVLSQTYQHFEVIILDDCSPDDGASKTVIEKYRDNPHVSHIIYNEVNSGSTFKQWETGINLTKGDLIWIAESDDKCEDTLLESLVRQFKQNENLVLAFCKTTTFYDDGHNTKLDPIPLLSTQVFDGSTFISKYMSHGNPVINASACLFRKNAALAADKKYMEFRGAGDRLFWTEISECGDVAVVNEWLNYMRQHPCNFTKKYNIDGTNQREDKFILDYIFDKGYLSSKRYRELKHIYAREHIFKMITDDQLKQELYELWGYNKWDQFMLKVEAWCNKLLGVKE